MLTKEGLLSMFLQMEAEVSKGLIQGVGSKSTRNKFLNGEHSLFRCSLTAESLCITKNQIVQLVGLGNVEQLTRILQIRGK